MRPPPTRSRATEKTRDACNSELQFISDIALLNKSSQSYRVSLAIMGSHSVTFHPTQVNTPQPVRLILDLATLERRNAELT